MIGAHMTWNYIISLTSNKQSGWKEVGVDWWNILRDLLADETHNIIFLVSWKAFVGEVEINFKCQSLMQIQLTIRESDK